MPPTVYAPLHCHTDYSLLDGAASVEKLVAKAKKLGLPALAITDHGNLFGALRPPNLARGNLVDQDCRDRS